MAPKARMRQANKLNEAKVTKRGKIPTTLVSFKSLWKILGKIGKAKFSCPVLFWGSIPRLTRTYEFVVNKAYYSNARHISGVHGGIWNVSHFFILYQNGTENIVFVLFATLRFKILTGMVLVSCFTIVVVKILVFEHFRIVFTISLDKKGMVWVI